MKRFIKYIIVFLLPILIGVIGMEYLIQSIPNDYTFKRDFLNDHAQEVEYLLLGNSHTYYGVNPAIISDNCYNLGHVAQSINWDYALLKKYESQWAKLKFIIMPIDYFTLYARTSKGKSPWRTKNYKIYYDIDAPILFKNNFELSSLTFEANMNRLSSYYLSRESAITCDINGYGVKQRRQKDLKTSGIAAARIHTKKHDNLDESIGILNKILELAKAKNIQVIFMSCPCYKTYNENLDSVQLSLTSNTISKIISKNDNCYYFNYREDINFVASDFQDAHHLNPIGADKFSRLLKLKIDSIEANQTKQQNLILKK